MYRVLRYRAVGICIGVLAVFLFFALGAGLPEVWRFIVYLLGFGIFLAGLFWRTPAEVASDNEEMRLRQVGERRLRDVCVGLAHKLGPLAEEEERRISELEASARNGDLIAYKELSVAVMAWEEEFRRRISELKARDHWNELLMRQAMYAALGMQGNPAGAAQDIADAEARIEQLSRRDGHSARNNETLAEAVRAIFAITMACRCRATMTMAEAAFAPRWVVEEEERRISELEARARNGDLIAYEEWKALHEKPQVTWFFFWKF